MESKNSPLLSITIPTYCREAELLYSLRRISEEIERLPAGEVEVHVVDDASPGDAGEKVREYVSAHAEFMIYHRHPVNIGLERNLVECTKLARGEYLWILGDDDYLEREDSLKMIMDHLRQNKYSFYVLNRTRRNYDLSHLITANWMHIDPDDNLHYNSLKEFCLQWGLISIIGFISVNIFRRCPFATLSSAPFAGTMYPQLGMMYEAFHNMPCLVISQPLICHRTQSQDEKINGWGRKDTEQCYFKDVKTRDVTHFGIRWIKMLKHLVNVGALDWNDVCKMPENTVINGYLIDFILNNIELALQLGHRETLRNWPLIDDFFEHLGLTNERKTRWMAMR